MIKRAKRAFCTNAIRNRTDSKTLWKHYQASKSVYVPPIVVKDGTSISGVVNIVNCFNDHFINIFAFKTKQFLITNNFNDLESMLSTTLVESFQIECITPYEVNQYIKKLAQMSRLVLMASGKLYLKKWRCNFYSHH